MISCRQIIVSCLIYLTQLSKNKELNTNGVLSVVTNKYWKNIEGFIQSSLYMIFESTFLEELLEVIYENYYIK